jgi:DNA-binding MarR family transcriptional regulator
VVEPTYQPISFEDRRAARTVYRAVSVFVGLHRRIRLSQMVTFIQVCVEEGLTVAELAKRCKVEPHLISRHLRDLGTLNRKNQPGLGLITVVQRFHGDKRERYVILTDHGASIARKVVALMKQSLGLE